MDKQQAREYVLSKKGAVEETPFSTPVPVFKVGGKMFALLNIHEEKPSINLKYPKDSIEMLRGQHEAIIPGYHMSKSHWNTVYFDGSLDDGFIKELVDISYDLVFRSLTKKLQKEVSES